MFGSCPFHEIVCTPFPPCEIISINPSQLWKQVGLPKFIIGWGKFGGPGNTNTVSGPKLFPCPALQVLQPALQVG